MTEKLEAPNEQQEITEPLEVEQQLSKEQIEKEIDKYWKAIDKEIGYEAYFNNWERLNYYRDLKLKLYK